MTELNHLGIGPNAKRSFMAFENAAVGCPRCGFATSDESLYDCPSCGIAWKRRPKPLETSRAPQVGDAVTFLCVVCGKDDTESPLVFAGGLDLAHKTCLALEGVPEVSNQYEQLVKRTPIESLGDASADQAEPKLSKSQRRRRNQKARAHALATADKVPVGNAL